MRTIRFLLQKEFLQIFRNKAMLPIIFLMPIIQLVVLSFAATYELKEVDMHLVDFDRSAASRTLVNKMEATGYFDVESYSRDVEEGIQKMRSNDIQLALVIPRHFGRDLQSGASTSVQLNIDAVDGATAGLIQGYGRSIIQDFSAEAQPQIKQTQLGREWAGINIIPAAWYNPNLDYIKYMVPGI